MKEKLREYFLKCKREVKVNDLVKMFNLSINETQELLQCLYELEKEGSIIATNNNSFAYIPPDFYLKRGIIKRSTKGNYYINLEHGDIAIVETNDIALITEGDVVYFEKVSSNKHAHQFIAKIKRIVKKETYESSYLITAQIKKDYSRGYFYIANENNERIYIPEKNIKGAYINDTVTVRLITERNSYIGKVENIIKRYNDIHIFTMVNVNGTLKAKPISSSYLYEVSKLPHDISNGDIISCSLKDNKCIFIKKIDDLNNGISLYASDFGFETSFSEEVLKEAEQLKSLNIREELLNRVDLRNLETITIDPKTAQDLDDAVSLVKDNDNYILYVSIADVSYYVKPGTKLFDCAKKRTTSLYPANTVIPMLPKQLSNDLCSLNEGEDKLTKTIKITISPTGDIVDFDILNSIIRNNKKMDYHKVNELLDGTSIDPEYIPYYNTLREMNRLSGILQNRRMKRGFIFFDVNEYEYEFNEKNEIINIHVKEKGQSQLMIENFMLIANEVVASYIKNLDVIAAYRNHPCPNMDQLGKILNDNRFLKKYQNSIRNASNPKLLQKILLSIVESKSPEETKYISKTILKGMARAYYSINNIGHYGLALEEYTKFTSPIREFTDLLNHLVVEYIISGRFEELETLTKDYEEMCINCSKKQIDAELFEQNINYMLLNKYISNLDGEELEAKVKFINNEFIYIQTNNGIYGIIPINKTQRKNDTVNIMGDHLNINDTIIVNIEYIQQINDEIKFKYIRKKQSKEKKKRRQQ